MSQAIAIADLRLSIRFTRIGGDVDTPAGIRWLRLAADAGESDAQAQIGDCYRLGQGLPQDGAQALRWYQLAAEDGHVPSLLGLAICARDGVGQTVDLAAARAYFIRAGETGDTNAQRLCGDFHALAHALVDMRAAVEWWTKAAEQDDSQAMVSLAKAYATGRGVAADLDAARTWLNKAMEQGDKTAESALEALPVSEVVP